MNAREIAYKSLKNIIKEHGFSNLVLRKNLNELKANNPTESRIKPITCGEL